MSRRFASLMGCFLLTAALSSPLAAQEKPPVVPHDLAGKDNCLMCHKPGAMAPVPDAPASHEGRPSTACLWCHAADSPMQGDGAPQPTHDMAGKDNCLMCHTPGAMAPVPDAPASHEGRGNETCQWCHKGPGN